MVSQHPASMLRAASLTRSGLVAVRDASESRPAQAVPGRRGPAGRPRPLSFGPSVYKTRKTSLLGVVGEWEETSPVGFLQCRSRGASKARPTFKWTLGPERTTRIFHLLEFPCVPNKPGVCFDLDAANSSWCLGGAGVLLGRGPGREPESPHPPSETPESLSCPPGFLPAAPEITVGASSPQVSGFCTRALRPQLEARAPATPPGRTWPGRTPCRQPRRPPESPRFTGQALVSGKKNASQLLKRPSSPLPSPAKARQMLLESASPARFTRPPSDVRFSVSADIGHGAEKIIHFSPQERASGRPGLGLLARLFIYSLFGKAALRGSVRTGLQLPLEADGSLCSFPAVSPTGGRDPSSVLGLGHEAMGSSMSGQPG